MTQITWLSILAESLLKLNATTEAELVLRECLTKLKEQKNNKRNHDGRYQLARIVEQLAKKFETVGKTDDAIRWRKELDSIKPTAPAKKAGGKPLIGIKRSSKKTQRP